MRLRIWAAAQDERERLLDLAGRWLAARGYAPGASGLAWDLVADGRWVERYQQGLRPLPLGRRFVVVPRAEASLALSPGERRARAGREIVTLVPGRAFGTGEHPTTRLLAARLERVVVPGSRWLDLGCGSGILSVVAARLAAGEVLAVDVDEEALSVARETLAANGVAGPVRVAACGLEALGRAAWDGIVCNISAPFVVAHAAELAARLAVRGRLVVSGFLDEETAEVRRALAAGGLTPTAGERLCGWALAEALRTGGG